MAGAKSKRLPDALPGRCGRPTRQTGKPCANVFGFRTATPHVEGAPCFLHGGISRRGDARVTRGTSSPASRKHFTETKLAPYLDADPDAQSLSLVQELEHLRAVYRWYVNETAELDAKLAADLLEAVGKMVKRIEDISANNAISRADFHRVLHAMGRVVDQEIPDQEIRRRIVEGWRQVRIG